jgi:DNA-binding transcriptional LysR family regulator
LLARTRDGVLPTAFAREVLVNVEAAIEAVERVEGELS